MKWFTSRRVLIIYHQFGLIPSSSFGCKLLTDRQTNKQTNKQINKPNRKQYTRPDPSGPGGVMKALETSETCEIEYFGIMQTLVTQKLSICALNAPCAYDAQRLYVHFGPNQKFFSMSGSQVMVKVVFFHLFRDLDLDL